MNDETIARMTLYPTTGLSISVSPQALQTHGLAAAAREAKEALENGWQEVRDCPYCTNGSVTHHGSMWWQTRKSRCHQCAGTGLVISDPSPSSSAAGADRVGSFPASWDDPVPNAEAKND